MALDAQRPDFSGLGELTVVSSGGGGHASPSEVMYPGGSQVDGGLLAPGDPIPENAGPGGRRPEWLKVRIGAGTTYAATKHVLRDEALNTVCEEARCPNIGECWALGTATFMILGSVCTRNCGFCAIDTGRPPVTDLDEPRRVAEAARLMGLRHVVVTSVNRDDREDGGAPVFADTIRRLRQELPGCFVEVLTPDFLGNWDALKLVVDARPDIYNHNVETVPRLSRRVRSRARHARSLELLRRVKELAPLMLTKSGMMLGLGETWDEIVDTMWELRQQRVDILTLGQYLRPSLRHLPIDRYYSPDEFAQLKEEGLRMGFSHVESGPLVRSSYHAHEQVPTTSGQ
jgi:lipoic acid synthetase